MTHNAQANLIALIDSAEDLIWSVDIDYRLVAFNRAFQRIFELDYGVKAAVGMNPQDLLPPERAALWRPLYERAFKEGPFRVEYSLVDGRILELSLNSIVVDGEATGISVFGKDITDRERAQKHIAHLASFPELNPSFIFETDLDGKIVYLNPATARKFPALREAGAEHPLLKDWPAIIASLKANVGHPIGRKVAADGLTLLQTANYVSEFEVVRAYCIDITEREQAEQALRNSEEMFRQFAENSRAVIYMAPATANGTHYVSPSYEEIWGRSCDSFYQNPMSWMEAIHPDDQAQAQSRFDRQMQGESTVSQYRIRTPDNQEKWIQDRAFPIRDQNGQLIRFGGIATDISKRKRRESEMVSTIRALGTC